LLCANNNGEMGFPEYNRMKKELRKLRVINAS